jgi:RNA polymerase sigma-70 factor (ECF subfamily)
MEPLLRRGSLGALRADGATDVPRGTPYPAPAARDTLPRMLAGGTGPPLSDEALAARALEDHSCLEMLLARYMDKIRACAWKMVGDPGEVEDLTQETLLRLIRSLPGFRARSGFSTWVYQVAHNTCVDAYRRRARERRLTVSLEVEGQDASSPRALILEGGDPEVLFEETIAECYVEQALASLPSDYARIARLRLIEGWSNDQVAAELGTSVASVKGKLKRARAQLRAFLAESRACPLCRAGSFRLSARGPQ